ncbi:hypothetical protein JQ616_29205 [Bradyrhizobium tropiciagri]|nr:hypothetical protein [Bradyrhizobium tropiciagri]
MFQCRSEPQLVSLGSVPPRTPGRSDAQVPHDPEHGESRYARIPHLYFYSGIRFTDPVYGLLDLEIALQRRSNDEIWLEIYCVGDGYQSGRGSGAEQPLIVEIRHGERKLTTVAWAYPNVLCGHFDPMYLEAKTALSVPDFEAADRIALPQICTVAASCSGAAPTFGAPAAHGH